jgi:hypothetical protein
MGQPAHQQIKRRLFGFQGDKTAIEQNVECFYLTAGKFAGIVKMRFPAKSIRMTGYRETDQGEGIFFDEYTDLCGELELFLHGGKGTAGFF